jgi:hypothetical protein
MSEKELRDETARRDEARAAETITGQLIQRGVRLFGNETPAELGDLAEEVERFEQAVAALGADSMRNAPDSAMPESPKLVLPERHDDEFVVRYVARINAAAEFLRDLRRERA